VSSLGVRQALPFLVFGTCTHKQTTMKKNKAINKTMMENI
jgi:hypothetical protein